jgi:hypothetical protein
MPNETDREAFRRRLGYRECFVGRPVVHDHDFVFRYNWSNDAADSLQ